MMRRGRFNTMAITFGLLLALAPNILLSEISNEQPKLQYELTKYYRLSTTGLSATGAAEIIPGRLLTLRREGVVGFAEADQAMEDVCPAVFHGSDSRTARSTLCEIAAGHAAHRFHITEVVCVTSIKVSTQLDTVSMYVVSCAEHRISAAHSYYSLLVFQFARGSLRTASAATVESVIDQVLDHADAETPTQQAVPPIARQMPAQLPDSSSTTTFKPVPGATQELSTVPALLPLPTVPAEQAAASTKPEPDGDQKPAAVPALPPVSAPEVSSNPAPPKADAPPPSNPAAVTDAHQVAVGQSVDQVKAILGQPDRIADLGGKVIYFYSKLKIMFVAGKVSEVDGQDNIQ